MATMSWQNLHYDLRIEPDLATFRFKGRLALSGIPSTAVAMLELNCIELAIADCRVTVDGRPCAARHRLVPDREILEVTLAEPTAQPLELQLAFAGRIDDRMAGFYRSGYTVNGSARFMAVTQFQESDARRAFPCFDHPRHKATFAVTLVIERGLTALSNGAVQAIEDLRDGRQAVHFETTPRMSTYLLFLGVGEFEQEIDAQDARVRLQATPGASRYGAVGRTMGRQALQFCEKYFGIPYPLSKMDLIGVPDFAFGAMENWGAITFRENLLYVHPGLTSKEGLERIAEVIAHEVTHQWFGNLVTPSDWRYLWLNESFATYFGYGIVDHYQPGWGVWDKFVLSHTDSALQRDSLIETFPIEIPGGEHLVINTSTAPIIYSKGGSILRMIKGYIGEAAFQRGLRHYLETYVYDCAGSRQFWQAFEALGDAPVSAIMRPWVEQPGYPLLSAAREGAFLQLSQQRFTLLPHATQARWPIPVVLTVFDPDGEQRRIDLLMEDRQQVVDIGEAAAVKVNTDQSGFYRVAYDSELRRALGPLVRDKRLSALDRWGLQSDLYAMVLAGGLALADYLSFLGWYAQEDAYLPLVSSGQHLRHAHLVLPAERRAAVAAIASRMAGATLARIGFAPQENDPHPLSALREHCLWQGVFFGEPASREFAAGACARVRRGEALDPDIMKPILQADALLNGEDALASLVDRLERSDSEHERLNVLAALGCFSERDMLAAARDYVMRHVPDRNRYLPLVVMAGNPYALADLWPWFLQSQEALASFHPLLLERVIAALVPTAGMVDPPGVRAFCTDFVARHAKAGDVVRLSLERLEVNLRLRQG
jgi:aminopeptidase N